MAGVRRRFKICVEVGCDNVAYNYSRHCFDHKPVAKYMRGNRGIMKANDKPCCVCGVVYVEPLLIKRKSYCREHYINAPSEAQRCMG